MICGYTVLLGPAYACAWLSIIPLYVPTENLEWAPELHGHALALFF